MGRTNDNRCVYLVSIMLHTDQLRPKTHNGPPLQHPYVVHHLML